MEQNFLEDVRQHLGLSEADFSKYTENAAEVEKILEENNVIFTYEFKLVFYSHIVSFCQRLEAKEKLNVTNSGFEEEVRMLLLTLIVISDVILCFLNFVSFSLDKCHICIII